MALRGKNQGAWSGTNTTSVTVTVAGYTIVAGDWIILAANSSSATAKTFPAGFSAITGCTQLVPTNSGSGPGSADVQAKMAVGGETSFVVSGGNGSWIANVLVYSGRATSPFTVTAAQTAIVAHALSPVSASFTGLTAHPGDDLVLIVPGGQEAESPATQAWTITPPTGFGNALNSSALFSFSTILMSCDYVGYPGGATGTLAATLTGETGDNTGYGGWLISLAAAPTGSISLGFVTGGGGGGTNINTSPSGVATSALGNNFYLTVVAAGGSAATTSPTITDTYSNTWVQIGSIFNPVSNAFYVSRYYCQNANGGANHQFTATWGGSLSAGSYLSVGQINGGSLTALYAGQSNQATYSSTTANPFTTGSVTISPPTTGSLLLSTLSFGLATASEGTITEANGFTLATMPATTFNPNSQLGSLAETVSGAYNASWSSTQANTSNTSFVAIIDTFNGGTIALVSPLMMGAKQTFVTDTYIQF